MYVNTNFAYVVPIGNPLLAFTVTPDAELNDISLLKKPITSNFSAPWRRSKSQFWIRNATLTYELDTEHFNLYARVCILIGGVAECSSLQEDQCLITRPNGNHMQNNALLTLALSFTLAFTSYFL